MEKLKLRRCEKCLLRGAEAEEFGKPGHWFRCWRAGVVSKGASCAFWEQRRPLRMHRAWAMPNKRTFEIKPIKALLAEEVIAGTWVDPFAGRSGEDKQLDFLAVKVIRNDLNPQLDTDHHLDALEFLKTVQTASADGLLYDPPYSTRQVKECYDSVGMEVTQETTRADFWTNIKREITRVVCSGGKVISFGWNSNGIGNSAGFILQRILIVAHGGIHNDTIVVVEYKRG